MISNKTLQDLIELLKSRSMKIATMESCTSGFLISTITDTEGSSSITDGGYVTYSNYAKILNGVDSDTIRKYGVYSKEVALAMAYACKSKNNANIGIGVTGTFGNIDENNNDSKVGVVYYAIVIDGREDARELNVPIESLKIKFSKATDKILRYHEKEFVVEMIINNLCELLNNDL